MNELWQAGGNRPQAGALSGRRLVGVRCGCAVEAHMTVQPDTFPIRVNLIPNPDSQEDSDTYSQGHRQWE